MLVGGVAHLGDELPPALGRDHQLPVLRAAADGDHVEDREGRRAELHHERHQRRDLADVARRRDGVHAHVEAERDGVADARDRLRPQALAPAVPVVLMLRAVE